MSDNGKHSEDKEKRIIRQMARIRGDIDWAARETKERVKNICLITEQDVKDLCPDHAEEIFHLMSICHRVYQFYLNALKDMMKLGQKCGVVMPGVQGVICDVEDAKNSLIDLRLTIMSWIRRFEGIPSESEKLEMLMSKPTPEQDAADRAEAFRTRGASLMKKDD